MPLAQGHGQRVTGVIRADGFPDGKQAGDHEFNVAFGCGAVSNNGHFNFPRRKFGDMRAGQTRRQQNDAPGMPHNNRCFYIFSVKNILNSHMLRLIFFKQPRYFIING